MKKKNTLQCKPGDEILVPVTCGSYARASVLKYLRNKTNSDEDGVFYIFLPIKLDAKVRFCPREWIRVLDTKPWDEI